MDNIDRKLLNLLQANARLTAEELADRVPLSPSAITRRLQRLRDEKVIAAEVVVLGAEARDSRLTAVVNVQLSRHQPAQWQDLKRMLVEAAEVQFCMETSGSNDVLMIISARDMSHFNEFADRLATHTLVRRYESSFVKRHVKVSLAVPLDE